MVSKITNSEIGSSHWFNNIVGIIRDNSNYTLTHLDNKEQIEKFAKVNLEAIQELKDSYDNLAQIVNKSLLEATKKRLEDMEIKL